MKEQGHDDLSLRGVGLLDDAAALKGWSRVNRYAGHGVQPIEAHIFKSDMKLASASTLERHFGSRVYIPHVIVPD